jgi:ankyrin repeat protein
MLCRAIKDENLPLIRALIRLQPSLLTVCFKQNPPHGSVWSIIAYASTRCNIEAMKLLLDEFKVHPCKVWWGGYTPLHHVVFVDNGPKDPNSNVYKAAELLLSRGADPHQRLGSTPSPIEFAEIYNRCSKGKNCRAVFSKEDKLVTFYYQLERVAVPLAGIGATALIGATVKTAYDWLIARAEQMRL